MNEVKEASAVAIKESNGTNVLEVTLTGKLAKEDYEQLVPTVERPVHAHGKIRMLVEMHDFHGWTAGALWQDIKFDTKHFRDIERVAMVGETKWQHGMAVFCKPFTSAQIRYFDRSAIAEARLWLTADRAAGAASCSPGITPLGVEAGGAGSCSVKRADWARIGGAPSSGAALRDGHLCPQQIVQGD